MLLLTSDSGRGIKITAEKDFSFSALHYSEKELTVKRHDCELEEAKETFLTVCYRQSGLGSNSCGPELDRKYQFDEKHFSFDFKLLAI